MNVIATPRLDLRTFGEADAAFILRLLNEPAFHAYIGDRGVRDLDGARDYLRRSVFASYQRHHFGLLAVTVRASGELIGMCGLLKRDPLPRPELGFAFVASSWGRGYASESARATLEWAERERGLRRVLALAAADNTASIRLLQKLNFTPDGDVTLPGIATPSRRFYRDAPSTAGAGKGCSQTRNG